MPAPKITGKQRSAFDSNSRIKVREQQLALAVIEGHELERLEIGRELHDNVNQLLSLSLLFLERAGKDRVHKSIFLQRSAECTRSAIEEIRKISSGLVSADMIRYFGLAGALDNICADTMLAYPVKITSTVDPLTERGMNDKLRQDIFRIVQEQLTNIIKHAEAASITIALSKNKNTISLSISDDGKGFDTTKNKKGIGMINIKSRAQTYGGKATFISRPGNGCVLKVTFPVRASLLNND